MLVMIYKCTRCGQRRVYGGGSTPERDRLVKLQCEGRCQCTTPHAYDSFEAVRSARNALAVQ